MPPLSFQEPLHNRKLTIGTKQTKKAIELGNAAEVYLAKDADERIITMITALCKDKGIKVNFVDSMMQLGKACSIKVGAAVAAIVAE